MLCTRSLLFAECAVELTLFVLPGYDLHKVRHERWNRALQHRRIAPYDVLVVDLRFVELLHNWR